MDLVNGVVDGSRVFNNEFIDQYKYHHAVSWRNYFTNGGYKLIRCFLWNFDVLSPFTAFDFLYDDAINFFSQNYVRSETLYFSCVMYGDYQFVENTENRSQILVRPFSQSKLRVKMH